MKEIIKKREKMKLLPLQIIEEIKNIILMNNLLPGDTLPTENELTESLNVSKSSVREAIKILEAVGIVEIKRGCGTILSKNSSKGFMNVLFYQLLMKEVNKNEFADFRKMLESAYTEMAIHNITKLEIEEIEENLKEFRKKVYDQTISADDDIKFHTLILKATHNSIVISLGEAILLLFKEGIEKALKKNPLHALNDHEIILQGIKEKNMDKIKECIKESVDMWSITL